MNYPRLVETTPIDIIANMKKAQEGFDAFSTLITAIYMASTGNHKEWSDTFNNALATKVALNNLEEAINARINRK